MKRIDWERQLGAPLPKQCEGPIWAMDGIVHQEEKGMCIRQLTAVLIALVMAAALAACEGKATPVEPLATATPGAAAGALTSTEWVLASLQGKPLARGTQISLGFEGDRFSSFAGCNTVAGTYVAADPGTLSLPELELTMELCLEPEGIMEQEKAYVDALVSTASYRLDENRLELQDATGKTVLVYERVPTGPMEGVLPGTKWVLSSLRGQPVLPGTYLSLEFGDRSLSGYTGCNFFHGGLDSSPSGATGDGALAIRSFEVTVMSCRQGIVAQEQETAYLEAMTSTVSYRRMADRLELRDATGETVLVYIRRADCAEEPANLAGSAWQLFSVDGQEPAEGPATWLAFLDDKWFVEYSECEGYISSYEATGHDLRAGFSARLGEICQDQVGRGVRALEVPSDYCLAQGRLQITTVPGQVFIYEPLPKAAQPPLEGPTWSLLSLVGARQIEGEAVAWPDPTWPMEGTEITVAFADGMASGSAGCNDYGAAYTLDGTSLDFGEVVATEKGCLAPEGVMEQEQRYLGALQDVTDYCLYGSLLWLWTGDDRALALTVQGAKGH